MATCPICHQETDEVVQQKEIEVRGAKYLRQMCYCPSCAVKFTFFQALGAGKAGEKGEEQGEKAGSKKS